MKRTLEGRVRKFLLTLGKKNRLMRCIALPLLIVSIVVFHIWGYLSDNRKRLSFAALFLVVIIFYSKRYFTTFANQDEQTPEEGTAVQTGEMELPSLAEGNDAALEDVYVLSISSSDAQREDTQREDTQHEDEQYEDTQHEDTEREDMQETLAEETGGDAGAQSLAELLEDRRPDFDKDDWRLILINKLHPIPEDYTFTLANIQSGKQCDERILDDLLSMIADAKEDGVTLNIASAYRTTDRQEMLFDNKVNKYLRGGMSYIEAYRESGRYSEPSGTSEHEVGLCVDINTPSYTNLSRGFADTAAGQWLRAHCAEYGFILRYPEGKEYITGVEYEPWHFRYVGQEAASYIMENGITLEEFWEEL